jgi:hypothetical protein
MRMRFDKLVKRVVGVVQLIDRWCCKGDGDGDDGGFVVGLCIGFWRETTPRPFNHNNHNNHNKHHNNHNNHSPVSPAIEPGINQNLMGNKQPDNWASNTTNETEVGERSRLIRQRNAI